MLIARGCALLLVTLLCDWFIGRVQTDCMFWLIIGCSFVRSVQYFLAVSVVVYCSRSYSTDVLHARDDFLTFMSSGDLNAVSLF